MRRSLSERRISCLERKSRAFSFNFEFATDGLVRFFYSGTWTYLVGHAAGRISISAEEGCVPILIADVLSDAFAFVGGPTSSDTRTDFGVRVKAAPWTCLVSSLVPRRRRLRALRAKSVFICYCCLWPGVLRRVSADLASLPWQLKKHVRNFRKEEKLFFF